MHPLRCQDTEWAIPQHRWSTPLTWTLTNPHTSPTHHSPHIPNTNPSTPRCLEPSKILEPWSLCSMMLICPRRRNGCNLPCLVLSCLSCMGQMYLILSDTDYLLLVSVALGWLCLVSETCEGSEATLVSIAPQNLGRWKAGSATQQVERQGEHTISEVPPEGNVPSTSLMHVSKRVLCRCVGERCLRTMMLHCASLDCVAGRGLIN